MIRDDVYVIECRHLGGQLDFSGPQPEGFFGSRAATGLTDDSMAKAIFAVQPDAVLAGDNIANWPRKIDVRWSARKKTW